MTADEIAAPKKASGSLYRHLEAMKSMGIIQKKRLNGNLVRWLPCR